MADSRILGRLKCGAAAGVLAAALLVCASAAPAVAQQTEDATQLNQRLFEAVKKNDMATVRSVLTAGADPMARDPSGQTPAGLAIDQGYFPIAHYILSVRNQNNLQRQRDGDDRRREEQASASAAPAESVREPLAPSWRATTAAGQAAEIPPARVTPPREAVKIAPARPKAPTAAAPKRSTEKARPAQLAAPPAPASAPPQLTNLPRLPSGAPNPFDPANDAAPTLPVITATGTLPAPPAKDAADPTAPAAPPARESYGNPLNRLWYGVTDLFSRDEAPEPPAPAAPRQSSALQPAVPLPPAPAAPVMPADRPAEPHAPAPEAAPAAPRFFAAPVRPEPVEPPREVVAITFTEPKPQSVAPTSEQPAAIAQGPIGRFFDNLMRRDTAPAEAPRVEAARTEPTVPAAAPEPQAEAARSPVEHFLIGLFRRETLPAEAKQIAARDEPTPAAVAPAAPARERPAEAARSPVEHFLIGLFRRETRPDEAPQTVAHAEPRAVIEVAAPPLSDAPPREGVSAFETAAARPHLLDLPGPLPIIADPTLTAPAAGAPPPPEPEAKAGYAVAPTVFAEAPRSGGLGDFLRGLFRAKAEEPRETLTAPAPKDGAGAGRFQLAALSGIVRDAERAPVPSAAAPRVAIGPLAIAGFSLSRALDDPAARGKRCFQKGREPGWYCLENIAWPAEIGQRMEVDSWLYRRGRVIVHYDAAGAARSLFALFPSEHFNAIVRFVEATLGPASSDSSRRVALIGEPAKLNLIATWTRRASADATPAVLEIRKFDTVRGPIPDTRNGFLSLSREGATPIFRYVSEADLMIQSMRMRGGGTSAPAPKL